MTRTLYLNNERSEQFLKQNIFQLIPDRFNRTNKLEQLEFKLEKIIGIQKPTRKIRK